MIDPATRDRLARGADISVEAGPCPDCGATWSANYQAEQAMCPNCAEYGVGADNSDTPRVDVPDLDDVVGS